MEGGWAVVSLYLWAMGLSAFFGFIRFIQRFASKTDRPEFDRVGCFVHVITSAAVGLLTYWLLAKRGLEQSVINFLLAVGGWGGPETIAVFQSIYATTVTKLAAKASKTED